MKSFTSYRGKDAYHGEVAANYESDRASEPVWRIEHAWIERWAAGLPKGARLLDMPVGTGRFMPIWAGLEIEVHAVDISEDMLAVLRRSEYGKNPRLVIEKADAEALPYAPDSFDFVVCWRLLHLLPDPIMRRVVCELARVCRGRVLLEVFGVAQSTRRFERLKVWVRRKFFPSRPSRPKPWAHIESFTHTESGLQEAFELAGLRVVRAETLVEYSGSPVRIFELERCSK